MQTFNVSLREVAREQKKVFDKVRKTKQSAVVVSRDKGPQVAIVPLEDLRELEKMKAQKSVQALLELAELGEKYHTEGPITNAVEDTKTVWD